MGRIVVGIDGSHSSIAALRWAVAEARVHGSRLDAVCAFQPPAALLGAAEAMGGAVPPDLGEGDVAAYTERTIEEAVAAAGDAEGVEIVPCALPGSAGKVLVKASTGADLLVVGRTTHGDIAGRLLGSVGLHCVHHAACPVVVVGDPRDGD